MTLIPNQVHQCHQDTNKNYSILGTEFQSLGLTNHYLRKVHARFAKYVLIIDRLKPKEDIHSNVMHDEKCSRV